MFIKQLFQQISSLSGHTIFFGADGFEVVTVREIEHFFPSRHPSLPAATALEDPQTWQSSWCVIAHSSATNIPFLADLSEQALPVYTNLHDSEACEPDLVSPTLTAFIQSLQHLQTITPQSKRLRWPRPPHPLSGEAIMALRERLIQLNGQASYLYWEFFIATYQDWLQASQ